MAMLFVNACMREDSRTERLARRWLAAYEGDVLEMDLRTWEGRPLDAASIGLYERSVAAHDFKDSLFDVAHQFAAADEIAIAAPVWNYAMPAILHDYLELVCSQGVTFDISDTGEYVSLVAARRLTYLATSGGPWPEGTDDHAFGYVRTLAERFWHIEDVRLVVADSLDMVGADVEGALSRALDAAR